MFTLRKITGVGIQMNFSLGKSYIIIDRQRNPKEFNEVFSKSYNQDDLEWCYAFVVGDGANEHALSNQQQAYIMTESGKTFDNLTFRQ